MKSNALTQQASSNPSTDAERIAVSWAQARENPVWMVANVTLVNLIRDKTILSGHPYDASFRDTLYEALQRLSRSLFVTEGTSTGLIDHPLFQKTYAWLLDRARYPIEIWELADLAEIIRVLSHYLDAYMGRSGPQDRRATLANTQAILLDSLLRKYTLPWWKKLYFTVTFRTSF